jgi:ATP-binding cassette subfamily B protein RaxB
MDLSSLSLGFTKKIVLIQQAQTTECGIACLAMLSSYYGSGVSLSECRRLLRPSDRGANLAQLIGHAKILGFDADPLRVELQDLDRVQLPCILHWDFQHFVILESLARGKAVICDPAEGIRSVPLSSVSTHFTGVVLEVRPNETFQKKPRAAGMDYVAPWVS